MSANTSTASSSRAPARAMQGLKRFRWEVVSRVKSTPWLYMPLVGSRSRDSMGNYRGLDRRTELLIDAYPRSANTYATFGFIHCQKTPVRVSHHLHAPAAMIYAAKHGVPAMTIIRDPLNACASMLAYAPNYGIEQAFRDYVNYYSAVAQCASDILIAKFETVTSELGQVVEAINAKFGKSFTVFSNSTEDIEAVRAMTKKISTLRFGDAAFDTGRNSVPSSVSTGPKQSLAALLGEQQDEMSVIRDARALFVDLQQHATL